MGCGAPAGPRATIFMAPQHRNGPRHRRRNAPRADPRRCGTTAPTGRPVGAGRGHAPHQRSRLIAVATRIERDIPWRAGTSAHPHTTPSPQGPATPPPRPGAAPHRPPRPPPCPRGAPPAPPPAAKCLAASGPSRCWRASWTGHRFPLLRHGWVWSLGAVAVRPPRRPGLPRPAPAAPRAMPPPPSSPRLLCVGAFALLAAVFVGQRAGELDACAVMGEKRRAKPVVENDFLHLAEGEDQHAEVVAVRRCTHAGRSGLRSSSAMASTAATRAAATA